MDVGSALGIAVNALGFAKTAASAAVNTAVEAKVREQANQALEQVGRAQEALLAVQASLFSMQSENNALKDEIRKLAEAASRREQYDLEETPGGALLLRSRTAPHHFVCPACHAAKGEYQILQTCGNHAYVVCPSRSCDQTYQVAVDRDAQAFRAERHGGDY